MQSGKTGIPNVNFGESLTMAAPVASQLFAVGKLSGNEVRRWAQSGVTKNR
jgi:hypothetical protein